jgi:hypothetical protein
LPHGGKGDGHGDGDGDGEGESIGRKTGWEKTGAAVDGGETSARFAVLAIAGTEL